MVPWNLDIGLESDILGLKYNPSNVPTLWYYRILDIYRSQVISIGLKDNPRNVPSGTIEPGYRGRV